MKKTKRAQAPKPRNQKFNAAMQELGRSNAARPHKLATDYRRKPKHAGKGWTE